MSPLERINCDNNLNVCGVLDLTFSFCVISPVIHTHLVECVCILSVDWACFDMFNSGI